MVSMISYTPVVSQFGVQVSRCSDLIKESLFVFRVRHKCKEEKEMRRCMQFIKAGLDDIDV